MKRPVYLFCVTIAGLLIASAAAHGARWNAKTVDWSANPNPKIGDWGFNRPGYPNGLYIHGVTVKRGEKVQNPFIYDNDVYDDVFDDELVYAMASLKELNLIGLIVTPVLTDFWGFSKPKWIETAFESRKRARASGIDMNRIPPITIGTEAESEKAGEKKDSAGARLYVRQINESYNNNPHLPVIISMGGQSATLASAYCIDPSIAEKCIVYYTDVRVYNGHYQWASKLITKHFRVVSWGDDNWWINKKSQNEWRVLPRPERAEAKDNDPNSGEWKLLTQMNVAQLDHIVYQMRHRGEYIGKDRKADAYGDGTFIHAWVPGMFDDAEIRSVRDSDVLHITRFTPKNEDRVKAFTLKILLNPKAYGR